MSSWIHNLSKEQVLRLIHQHGLDPTAQLDLLRRRLRQFAAAHPNVIRNPDTPDPSTETKANRNRMPADEEAGTSAGTIREITATDTMDRMKLINQMRKWGHHFDGKDPLAFLERAEELRLGYGLEADQLLQGLPEMLRGDALLWYRNSYGSWATWDEFSNQFRAHYLPPDYQRRLKGEIQGHQQKAGESFRTYATTLLTMMRRAGGYSPQDQVAQVYENMDPEFQLYIPFNDQLTMNELSSRVTRCEEINRRRRDRCSEPGPKPGPTIAAIEYSKYECCWRCKQRGHIRQDCKRPAKKFCSQCGKDGVLSRDCHPPTGNAGRAGDVAAVTQPDSE